MEDTIAPAAAAVPTRAQPRAASHLLSLATHAGLAAEASSSTAPRPKVARKAGVLSDTKEEEDANPRATKRTRDDDMASDKAFDKVVDSDGAATVPLYTQREGVMRMVGRRDNCYIIRRRINWALPHLHSLSVSHARTFRAPTCAVGHVIVAPQLDFSQDEKDWLVARRKARLTVRFPEGEQNRIPFAYRLAVYLQPAADAKWPQTTTPFEPPMNATSTSIVFPPAWFIDVPPTLYIYFELKIDAQQAVVHVETQRRLRASAIVADMNAARAAGHLTDCRVLCAHNETVDVHKTIVALRCPDLGKMIKWGAAAATGEIDMTEFSAAAVQMFMDVVYTDVVDTSRELAPLHLMTIVDLLELSRMYDLQAGIKGGEYLLRSLYKRHPQEIKDILIVAKAYDLDDFVAQVGRINTQLAEAVWSAK
jgi:hypothetical protein